MIPGKLYRFKAEPNMILKKYRIIGSLRTEVVTNNKILMFLKKVQGVETGSRILHEYFFLDLDGEIFSVYFPEKYMKERFVLLKID